MLCLFCIMDIATTMAVGFTINHIAAILLPGIKVFAFEANNGHNHYEKIVGRWVVHDLISISSLAIGLHDERIAREQKERTTSLTVIKSELITGEIHGKSQKE